MMGALLGLGMALSCPAPAVSASEGAYSELEQPGSGLQCRSLRVFTSKSLEQAKAGAERTVRSQSRYTGLRLDRAGKQEWILKWKRAQNGQNYAYVAALKHDGGIVRVLLNISCGAGCRPDKAASQAEMEAFFKGMD
jgi:hypothetical protein